ncbi:Lactosylceramide 4-alpha-galactosyltransferase [Araneus ventricosus]|uniref:Lactosylceramide 4-alpha-galactosyltransferase n=1 Tax=Araneus ventricosus TaxID=182803 RepID=A0A4Y2E9G2_ARAVE|nr:Lactosylceramide 4-alpha-galactosyltransferase [Araneus ventricosus]
MTFYDDPLNRKCESNTNLLRTKDTMECLAANTIFFLETSNSSHLSARQACAVESAALHHPEWQVRVLFASSQPLNLTNSFMELFTLFGNVRFLRMELDFIMPGTPLWYWYQKGSWRSSPHKIVHLSDAIRLCLLWKYGGIYLDTDVIVLRSLSKLRNAVSFDSGTNLGNSFLSFDRGQSLLRFTLADYVSSYNPYSFANNGPVLLNRNFKEHCKPKFNNATDNICHVNVLPRKSVYPIDYSQWQVYFKPQTATLSETAFNSSYVIHVWNKMNSDGKMMVGDNSWYEMAMKRHCPKVYELVADIGYA